MIFHVTVNLFLCISMIHMNMKLVTHPNNDIKCLLYFGDPSGRWPPAKKSTTPTFSTFQKGAGDVTDAFFVDPPFYAHSKT